MKKRILGRRVPPEFRHISYPLSPLPPNPEEAARMVRMDMPIYDQGALGSSVSCAMASIMALMEENRGYGR